MLCQNRVTVIAANDSLKTIIHFICRGGGGVRVRCFTICSSLRECSSLIASMKFKIVGLVQLTILLKPLCHPFARLDDLGQGCKPSFFFGGNNRSNFTNICNLTSLGHDFPIK